MSTTNYRVGDCPSGEAAKLATQLPVVACRNKLLMSPAAALQSTTDDDPRAAQPAERRR